MTEAAAVQAPLANGHAPETAPPPPAKPEAIAPQFSVLARKEAALQRKREELKAERAALDAEKAEAQALKERYGTKPKSPREALERYGFDYKAATEYELSDGVPTPEGVARATVAEEIAAFRKEQEELQQKQLQDQLAAQQAQAEETLSAFKEEIGLFVKGKPTEYELISIFNAENLIYDTVEEYFHKHKKALSIKEAADLVEKYCGEQAELYEKSARYKAKHGQADPAPKPGEGKPNITATREAAQRRTLSNDLTTSTPSLVSPRVEADRMSRALAALNK
jgi:hypothetical protein